MSCFRVNYAYTRVVTEIVRSRCVLLEILRDIHMLLQ